MLDRIFDVCEDVSSILHSNIDHIAEIYNADVDKLLVGSERPLIPMDAAHLGGFSAATVQDRTAIVFNGCSEKTLRLNELSAPSLITKLTSYEVAQVILCGFAIPNEAGKNIITDTSPTSATFYSNLVDNDELLTKYYQCLQTMTLSNMAIYEKDLVQFVLRYLSKVPWEQAAGINYLPYSIEQICSAIHSQNQYDIDYFSYFVDDLMCWQIYNSTGVALTEYPIRYVISLVKN